SSRSASVSASRLRRRSGGGRPPRLRSTRSTAPGPRSSARAISLTDSPRRQRSHSSRRSCAEYLLRLLATAPPLARQLTECCDDGLRPPSVTRAVRPEHALRPGGSGCAGRVFPSNRLLLAATDRTSAPPRLG